MQYILTPLAHVPRFPPLLVIFVRENEEKASSLSWASYVRDVYLWACFALSKSPSRESWEDTGRKPRAAATGLSHSLLP